MAEITGALVKELREKTGAGILDCKKALVETNGDLEQAVSYLREKGIAKAAKKDGKIAAEGLSRAAFSGNQGVIFELNSETDFVARNEIFLQTMDQIQEALLATTVTTVEEFLESEIAGQKVSDLLAAATATIGEKISLRRFQKVTKTDEQSFGAYVHMGGKLAGLVVLAHNKPELAEKMAIQSVVMSPICLSADDLDPQYVANEKNVIVENIKNDPVFSGKPESVIEKTVAGRLNKILKEVCMLDQVFYEEQNVTVAEVLKREGTEVLQFVKYTTGEGIEKQADNFVEEVMSQAFGK